MIITTSNYYDSIKHVDWNKVPDSLKKTRDTLIPDASKNDWKIYQGDEDVRRVVEKYFSYIGKYVIVPKEAKPASSKSKAASKAAQENVSEETKQQAHELAIDLIKVYVLRGDSYEHLKKSYLGSSNDAGSAQIRSDKIIVDRIGTLAVNITFSLRRIFDEIKKGASIETPQGQSKKGTVKKRADLPEPKQVTHIPTATAFIKRYAALHGKVKTRDQILSLVHGLQKAITEQRIKKDSHGIREIEKMQSELISLATGMGESAKIEIDAQSLAHYNEIAKGEEVRTSVRLLKSFISMSGKAYDKAKAATLCKRMGNALQTIPKEDPYLHQLALAIESIEAYTNSKAKIIGIPSSSLHGLAGIAAGSSLQGLGAVSFKEGVIIGLLRAQNVKSLSESELKRAFKRTVAPGLCLEVAKSLIRRGELTMDILRSPAAGRSNDRSGLNGIDSGGHEITPLDILETRLNGFGGLNGLSSGLGSVQPNYQPGIKPPAQQTPVAPLTDQTNSGTVSAKDLAKMTFKTIGYGGKFKEVVGDPAIGFKMMVYGKPFQGKSSFVIELSKELVSLGKGKVAYVCLEEGISMSMQKKVIEFGADKVDGLDFMSTMPVSFNGYGFIVIDSVSDRNISREQLRQMFLANPNTCFICIFHSTKDGGARGGLDYLHDMDVALRIEAHKPFVEKNRFL